MRKRTQTQGSYRDDVSWHSSNDVRIVARPRKKEEAAGPHQRLEYVWCIGFLVHGRVQVYEQSGQQLHLACGRSCEWSKHSVRMQPHVHTFRYSITLRLQLTPIAHTFSTADLPVRSCVSEEVESAHVAVSLITSICTETQPCTAHAHQPILATEHKMRADAGTHKTPRRRKAGTPFIHVCVCH